MKIALYLRKSTDEQADSLDTQRSNATTFVETRVGWTVETEFRDAGISRDEFTPGRRRGWFAMLEAAKARTVDVIVVREMSRVGSNIGRSLVFVEDLLATGVRLYQYVDGREITMGNALESVSLALQFFGSQGEVEGIRSRTREALFTRAREGKVAGGVVYGYRNAPSAETTKSRRGDTRPAFYTREIDPKEAEVVRWVFERYATTSDGYGAIAKALNLRGVEAPRATRGGLSGWSSSTIHSLLEHEIYRGRIVYGVQRKTYVGGSKKRVQTPESEWTILEKPELRIVDEGVWRTVAARRAANIRGTIANKGGGRVTNLLSHILRCGVCGSPMFVVNTRASYENTAAYTCSAHEARRGVASLDGAQCTNTYRRPVEEVNRFVTTWLEEEMLREDLLTEALEEVRRRIQDRVQKEHADTPVLRKRSAKLKGEIDRFAEMALEAPAEVAGVFYAKLSERKKELDEVETKIHAATVAPNAVDFEVRRLAATAEKRVRALREVLSSENIEPARALLRALFPDGIKADMVEIQNTTGKGRKTRKRFALSADASGEWPLVVLRGGAEVSAPIEASSAGFEPA